jgi:phosphatidylserine decarboxylase
MRIPTLAAQIAILLLSVAVVFSQIWTFPFPSTFAQPFLGPKERWPEDQIKGWVESGLFEPAFVQFFNRDPERAIPPGDNLVAPADGVIKEIVKTETKTYYIVGLSFWDVHVVRTPVAGTVTDVYEEGEVVFRDASETAGLVFLKEKASPVQKTVTIVTDAGQEYKVRLITSWWASRLKVSARVGQKIGKGDRIGRILLGSSVVIDAPTTDVFDTPVGSRVVAGETVICKK